MKAQALRIAHDLGWLCLALLAGSAALWAWDIYKLFGGGS